MQQKAVAETTEVEIAATGVAPEKAAWFHARLQRILSKHRSSGPEAWKSISRGLLTPDLPFPLHQMMYYGCYKTYPHNSPPAWIPDRESVPTTNIGRLLQRRGKELLGQKYEEPLSSFSDLQKFSVAKPEVYWKVIFEEMGISFSPPPNSILPGHHNIFGGNWLPGARLNSASLCLCTNAKKDIDDVVILWRDEEGDHDDDVHTMTLKELRAEVWHTAHAIEAMGLPKNSNIAIDMPMSVTAVIIYLAVILANHAAVLLADTFASDEIATRLRLTNATAIFTQDIIIRGGEELPLYRKVAAAAAPSAIVVPARSGSTTRGLRGCDISWQDFLATSATKRDVPYASTVPPIDGHTSIVFSSGTTGNPKGIPWTHATTLKAAADAWAHMDIRRGDTVAWSTTNLGWMMSPWLIYASLINGSSVALYNGTPLGRGFATFVQDAKITMLGVTPSVVRTWKIADCIRGLDWSTIRCFASSGEVSDVDDYLWLMGRAGYKPVIEYWGSAEIGGAFVTGSLLQPQALAACSTPAMGCQLFVMGSDGEPYPEDTPGIGELALNPSILGSSTLLLINGRFYDIYFRGMPMRNDLVLQRCGDVIELAPDGYYRARGRIEDNFNPSNASVNSIDIERICNAVDDAILETAAVVVPSSELIIIVVFKDQNLMVNFDRLRMAFNSALQRKLDPLLMVSSVVQLPFLPRNAANMVMRRSLREKFTPPAPRCNNVSFIRKYVFF